MTITKEYYTNATEKVLETKNLNMEFLNCMFEYYKHEYEKKYKGRGTSKTLEEFGEAIHKFFTIPVSFGNTPEELVINRHYQSIDAAIKKTHEYFNKLFSTT